MDTNENTRSADGNARSPKKAAPRMSASDVGGRPRRPAEAGKEGGAKRPENPPQKSAPRMSASDAGGRPRRPVEAGKTENGDAGRTRASRRPPAQSASAGQEKQRTAGAEAGPVRPRKASGTESAQKRRDQGQSAQAGGSRKSSEAVKRRPDSAKRKASGDSGYQPYRNANRKRKAQRASSFKTFFSAQNPVLKWYEKLRYSKDSFAEDSELAKQRKERRAADAAKRRRKQNVFNTPSVIYTQPAAFNRDRLIIQLISVLAVVAAFVIGLSVFFKVKVITVSGASVYSPYSIQEASGISTGDNLLTFSRARAASQIRAKLPYVKSVRIGIKLPDTVNIEIKEDSVVYAIQDDTGIWWLMSSQGKVTEMANNSTASKYTQITGLTLTDPAVGQIGVPTERTALPLESTEGAEGTTEETTLPTVAPANVVTGQQKMDVLLEILTAMEDNDIVGSIASIDVTYLDDIVLWYGTQYQVNLGDGTDTVHPISYKIACMYDAILQMADYTTGILDVSFTIRENQVVLTPFSS